MAKPPGPPPQPISLRVLRGNPGKRPLRYGPQPEIPPSPPTPPAFLDEFARGEWGRIAQQLHRLHLLSCIDLMPLAAYCQAYSRWRTAEVMLLEAARKDPATHGFLVKAAEGHLRASPLVRIARDSAADMVRYAGEFGMTPVARARIAAGPLGEPPGGSKFDGLIA
jgi:P27 family predicted phage terminase small subunit